MIHSIQHIIAYKGACHIYDAVGYLLMLILPPGSFPKIEVCIFIEIQGLLFLASITEVNTLSYLVLTTSGKNV